MKITRNQRTMVILFFLVLCGTLLLPPVFSGSLKARPDGERKTWTGNGKSTLATVGWGVIKLEPRKENGSYVNTKFTVHYSLDADVFPTVKRLQAVVFSNEDFTTPHVSKILAEASSREGAASVGFDFEIAKPGFYHIAYGPRLGYFDPGTKKGSPTHYRVSVTSGSGTIQWVSEWFGDATIVRTGANALEASRVSFVAPDTYHDKTLLDLVGVPKEARTFLVERTSW